MFKIRNTRLESIMFKGCGTVPITAFAQDGSLDEFIHDHFPAVGVRIAFDILIVRVSHLWLKINPFTRLRESSDKWVQGSRILKCFRYVGVQEKFCY